MNAKVNSGKFFCGCKHKFGLNCQAVCDARGRFMDISIVFPGSTSDCLAFEGVLLIRKLEDGLLAPGLCIFGDNAYLNTTYMATPYTGAVSGCRDAYNFYHSQVRIRIECAFGMLTHQWAILRKAIPMGISLQRSVALVVALAKLHNFCIDETVPSMTAADDLQLLLDGGVPLERSNAAQMLLRCDYQDSSWMVDTISKIWIVSHAVNEREMQHAIMLDFYHVSDCAFKSKTAILHTS